MNVQVSPAIIYPTQATELTLTLQNPSSFVATDVALANTFAAGQTIIGVVSNSCGGILTATPGTDTFTLTGGTIPASPGIDPGACQIVLEVTAGTAGTYTTSVAAGDLTGTVDGAADQNISGSQSTMSVVVEPVNLDIAIYYTGTTTVQRVNAAEEQTDLVLTLINNNRTAVTNTGFDYDLGSVPLRVPDGSATPAIPGIATVNTCGGTISTQTSVLSPGSANDFPSSRIILENADPIPADGSCEIRVPIETTYRQMRPIVKAPLSRICPQGS